jgi:hypothetical protein
MNLENMLENYALDNLYYNGEFGANIYMNDVEFKLKYKDMDDNKLSLLIKKYNNLGCNIRYQYSVSGNLIVYGTSNKNNYFKFIYAIKNIKQQEELKQLFYSLQK